MFKTIVQDLYTRVFVASKSSILALAVACGDVITQDMLASSNKWVHGIAGVVSFLLLMYKGQASLPAPAPTVK